MLGRMADRPVLYVDLGSPYAYLAVERAPALLGAEPELRPVLLGAIFARRGSGSWSATPERAARVADLEARAARAGLPPFAWPPGWPADGLAAMRAATWAAMQGRTTAFARSAFRLQFFAEGATSQTSRCSRRPRATRAWTPRRCSPRSPTLRSSSGCATRRRRRGMWASAESPTLAIGGVSHYGDDRLAAAAA